jgi:hypothetical protein
MNHFIIPYAGNKRKEYNIIKNNIDYTNKKIIIEPFGGLCAISYEIYKEKGNIYTFYLNDKIKNKFESQIYFILEDNWIIQLLFKSKSAFTYDKKYQMTKRNTKHMFITW